MISKLFLDMDGVLVNFRGQCEKLNCIEGNKVDWSVIHNAGSDFWSEMEWLPEGKELYEFVKKVCTEENIELYILTSVTFNEGKVGKLTWIKNNTDIDRHHIIITNIGKEKAYYADPESLLIDDFKKNCDAFSTAGGQVIKYETNKQTKDELLTLLGL